MKMFLQEHFPAISACQIFLHKLLRIKDFRCLVVHERKNLLRHWILPDRSE